MNIFMALNVKRRTTPDDKKPKSCLGKTTPIGRGRK
jgi:hypothetical protein